MNYLNPEDIIKVTLILFSVIDILGAIPIILQLKARAGNIQSKKATIVAGIIMIVFLFLGDSILKLFGIDVQSFALAGAIILFLLGMEMILGKTIFVPEAEDKSSSIMPLAFPIIAGAGTMTTIISLKSEYGDWDILVGILVNLVFIYLVLRSINFIERKLGKGGVSILRKVFGIILLAIAIKLAKNQFHF
jgi:multiple antibiotic resistance protein